VLGWRGLLATHRHPDRVGATPYLGRIRQDDLVVAAGLVAEAPGEAHRPNVAAERPGHAIDPTQQHRGGVVQASTVANELIGDAKAQVVAFIVGGNGGIPRTEQLARVSRSTSWPLRRALISTGRGYRHDRCW